MSFENDLKARRAGILMEIEELRTRAAVLEGVLAAYDAVIVHCDPSAAPLAAARQPKRRMPAPLPPELRRLNKTQAVFDVLREAGRPISTGECVSAIAASQGLATDDPGLRRFPSHVSATLIALLKRERVRKTTATDGRTLLWEVAA